MSDYNKEVFEVTRRMCRTDRDLQFSISESKRQQRIYTSYPDIHLEGIPLSGVEPKIYVSNRRTFQAAKLLVKEYKDVCVLNFASAMNPGGGVFNGANAQEECLCRASTLYECISDDDVYKRFYEVHRKECKSAIYNDDCIYTPNVMVFRRDNTYYDILPREQWYKCSVISCAAPNLRKVPSNRHNYGGNESRAYIDNKRLYEIQYKRLCRILEIAIINRTEALVLGAFGCGAFKNPAWVVADAMVDSIERYKNYFKVIEIAIPDTKYSKENHDIFAKKFN